MFHFVLELNSSSINEEESSPLCNDVGSNLFMATGRSGGVRTMTRDAYSNLLVVEL